MKKFITTFESLFLLLIALPVYAKTAPVSNPNQTPHTAILRGNKYVVIDAAGKSKDWIKSQKQLYKKKGERVIIKNFTDAKHPNAITVAFDQTGKAVLVSKGSRSTASTKPAQ